MSHGLVIGKFYPPHAGHHLLIRTAAHACDTVSVVVMASSAETIAPETRVAWLAEEHQDTPGVKVTGIMDEVPIDYGDTRIWDEHVALMKRALERIAAPSVTAVFTSEPYGAELARRFGAASVSVDPDRKLAAISSTRVRADPAGCWEFLSAPVRAGLAIRIVALGAESTGTTTLARALASHFRTRWVPEYGRDYTVTKLARARAAAQLACSGMPQMQDLRWESAEFEHIARRQVELEEREARLGGPVLICDTDAFTTAIWHERYVGRASDAVLRIAASTRHALYLVTDDEGVPFEQDGLRDGESIRRWMTQRFVSALSEAERPHLLLSGSREDRLQRAIGAVGRLLARGWKLAPPLA